MTVSKYIMVITDIGEECDDEAAIYYLYQQTIRDPSIFVEVLCVAGKLSEQERIQRLYNYLEIKDTTNFKVGKMSDMPKYSNISSDKTILQIGPSNQCPIPYQTLLGEYNYILLGKLGTTNSTKGNPYNFALHMSNYSKNSIILDTKVNGETRIPLFTMNVSKLFPNKVQKEIIRMGFKNTLGRAPPSLNFLNQLVAPGGANYNTAKSIYDTVYSVNSFDNITLSEDALNAALHFNLNFNQSQTEGLARMLIAFNHLFDIPVSQIFESTDDIFSEEILWNQNHILSKPFTKYQQLLLQHPNMGLTPAYDLLAAWSITIDKVDFNYYFENQTENIWNLRKEVIPDLLDF